MIKISPANETSTKGLLETKAHLESKLTPNDIQSWLKQWKKYDYNIYFYPYQKISISESNGNYFENYVHLYLNEVNIFFLKKILIFNLEKRPCKR